MPALITHELFGEEAEYLLPSGSIAGPEERTAFILGCQGPDPLFFGWTAPHMFAANSQLGSTMHSTNMSAYFDALRAATRRIPERERGIAEAFCLGLLAHYALDRAAHPFVYGAEFDILRAQTGLEDAGSQVHALIESELDSFMLWRLRQQTVLDRAPESFLEQTPRIGLVAGSLMSQVALEVYGVRISAKVFGGCIADMQRFYRIVETQGARASLALGRLERMVRRGGQSLLYALAHPVLQDGSSPFANLEHYEWRNPWTEESSTDSFVDRFELALSGFAELAQHYVEGVSGRQLTGGTNYNGVPMEDESVSIPLPEV